MTEQNARGPRLGFATYQELFPRIFANAVEGICLTSTDGRIYAANPAACRIFGRSEEEICRLGRDALLNPDDPRLAAALQERRRTGRGQSELTLVRPDGTQVTVDVTSAVLAGADLAAPTVVFLRDVTERVRDREELARERALLDQVFASLEDVILVTDARTRLVVRVNAAAERTLGWKAADLVGRDTAILHPTREQYDRVGREARECFLARRSYSGEMDLLRKDGTPVPFRFFSRPVEEGSLSILVNVLHDLREERQAEAIRARLQAALFQTQKLESLGALAGGLAHDFNNLLVTMLAGATTAAAGLPPGDARREPLDDIAAAAHRAAELVRQLLAYSGRATGTLLPVDLAAAVRETNGLLRASVPRKVSLFIDLPASPLPVLGDAGELRQVVVNLVQNAGEALDEREGRITVTAGLDTCAEGHPALALAQPPLAPGRYAWVQVADDGPGMPPEVAARALDPFFSTKGLGRGLGLAAAAGIVRVHRGVLELESQAGRGTRVRAWIPARAESEKAGRTAARNGRRVLLVDDEPLVRRATKRLLESGGYEVVEASDGLEAVERFRERPEAFDVVLLDLSMPRMGGEEAFAALRAVRPDVPVVLSSGYADGGPDRLLSQPAVAFAAKPYDRRELLAALAAVRGSP
jgi:PAS domain S-box-containing protein